VATVQTRVEFEEANEANIVSACELHRLPQLVHRVDDDSHHAVCRLGASGGVVISLLFTAQAESTAIAAIVNAVRIDAIGFLPLFLSLVSNTTENERRIDAAERKIVQPQIVDSHPARRADDAVERGTPCSYQGG